MSGLQDNYSIPENMTRQICFNLTILNSTYYGNYSINITTDPADPEEMGKYYVKQVHVYVHIATVSRTCICSYSEKHVHVTCICTCTCTCNYSE